MLSSFEIAKGVNEPDNLIWFTGENMFSWPLVKSSKLDHANLEAWRSHLDSQNQPQSEKHQVLIHETRVVEQYVPENRAAIALI